MPQGHHGSHSSRFGTFNTGNGRPSSSAVAGLLLDHDLFEGLLERVDVLERRVEALLEREELLSDELSSLRSQVGDVLAEVDDSQAF